MRIFSYPSPWRSSESEVPATKCTKKNKKRSFCCFIVYSVGDWSKKEIMFNLICMLNVPYTAVWRASNRVMELCIRDSEKLLNYYYYNTSTHEIIISKDTNVHFSFEMEIAMFGLHCYNMLHGRIRICRWILDLECTMYNIHPCICVYSLCTKPLESYMVFSKPQLSAFDPVFVASWLRYTHTSGIIVCMLHHILLASAL